MSWVELIKEQVAAGFDILDDLVRDITWTNRTNPQFSDGEYTYTETPKAVGGVVASFESRLIDNERIQVHDKQLVVQTSQVDSITADDLFTVDSRVYSVKDYSEDPAGATLTIHLRPV
jgi:hypothetical protein